MTDEKDPQIHELAGGWITERKGTVVPGFLKLTYVGFCAFGLVYLVRYWQGELGHETRGPLVQQANALAELPGSAWLAVIGGCVVLFTLGLLWFAFVARTEE